MGSIQRLRPNPVWSSGLWVGSIRSFIFFLSGLDFTIAGALFTVVGALFGALVGATIGSLPRDTIEKEEHLTGRLLFVSVVAGAVVWAVIWALVWAFVVAIIEAIIEL
jgi:hypothetical protein